MWDSSQITASLNQFNFLTKGITSTLNHGFGASAPNGWLLKALCGESAFFIYFLNSQFVAVGEMTSQRD
jgi:hypothetical protein|tara:strand:- start:26964 stop:27170 length:207 start_codon:yes stop_codon:yes gene_type:complete